MDGKVPVSVVLLTGASGFLGRHVLQHLLALGHRVKAPVRGAKPSVQESRLFQPVHVADLFSLSRGELDSLVSGTDILIHAAWYTTHSDVLTSVKNLDCLCGSLELARAFIQKGGRRFVGIGTWFEYDASFGLLKHTTPLLPKTLYAKSKVALASVVEQYLKQNGCSFLWLRVFNLYGARPDSGEPVSKLVPTLHTNLSRGQAVPLTEGNQILDYLEVLEAAKQVARLSLSDVSGYANVCSGKGTSVRELAEHIADMYDRRDLLHFGAKPTRQGEPDFVVGVPHVF